MNEELPMKMRLDHLHTRNYFNLSEVAEAAGVTRAIVLRMLTRHPVTREQAEAVLHVLSTPEMSLSLDNVDVVLWSDFLILYCARATDNTHFDKDEFHFCYARDEGHAKELFQPWVKRMSSELPDVHYTPVPYGLNVGGTYIDGTMQMKEPELKTT